MVVMQRRPQSRARPTPDLLKKPRADINMEINIMAHRSATLPTNVRTWSALIHHAMRGRPKPTGARPNPTFGPSAAPVSSGSLPPPNAAPPPRTIRKGPESSTAKVARIAKQLKDEEATPPFIPRDLVL